MWAGVHERHIRQTLFKKLYEINIHQALLAKDKKTDVSNEDVGLGYGISQTSDWSGALIQTPELKEQNKYILKTIKTRFAGNNEKCYTIGVDYSKMKLLNLDDSQQEIPIHIKDMLKEQQNKINKEESNIGFDFS